MLTNYRTIIKWSNKRVTTALNDGKLKKRKRKKEKNLRINKKFSNLIFQKNTIFRSITWHNASVSRCLTQVHSDLFPTQLPANVYPGRKQRMA